MKIKFLSALSIAALCSISLPGFAQSHSDVNPTGGGDHMPYCSISGDHQPGHVTTTSPDDDYPITYKYTVHGEGRGWHPNHTEYHNKIATLSLFSYKGVSTPVMPGVVGDTAIVDGVQQDLYKQPDNNLDSNVNSASYVPNSPDPHWVFKWRHAFFSMNDDWNEGAINNLLPLVADWSWDIAYFAAGQFWWMGGANDDWGFSERLWNYTGATDSNNVSVPACANSFTSLSNILGSYYTSY